MQLRTRAALVAALGFVFVSTAFTASAEAGTRAKNHIHNLMINSAARPPARGKVDFMQTSAQSVVKITVQGAEAGATYDIVVGGAVKDQISIDASGRGRVIHRSRSRGSAARPLPFDPRGSNVQIASPGGVILWADVPETEEESDELIEIPLTLTPAPGVT